MKKKFLMALMAFCMVASLAGCGDNGTSKKEVDVEENSVESDDSETSTDNEYTNLTASEGFEFESNGDGTCTLTKIGACIDSVVVIPEKSPAGDTVTMIAEYAFYDAEDIESIVFAGRTMELDTKAFQSCSAEKIVITGCDMVIGENAFSYCEDIAEVYISNSKIDIGTYAFYDCGKDMNIKIANCTGVLDEKSFQSCAAVELTIAGSTLKLDENVFSYCEDIATISVDNSVLEIGSYAFYDSGDDTVVTFTDCNLDMDDKAFQSSCLVTLTITGCETVMGENTFSYCEDLTDVTIGANSTEIGSYSFYDCSDLTNVSIAADSEDDSITILLDDKAFQSSGVQNVIIGRGSVELGDNAFSYCENLTSVEFKGSSLKVGDYAFYDCPAEMMINFNGSAYNKESIENVK